MPIEKKEGGEGKKKKKKKEQAKDKTALNMCVKVRTIHLLAG